MYVHAMCTCMFRSSTSLLYCHRRAAQEVYHQQVLAKDVQSAPSERDVSLLVNKQVRDHVLQERGSLIV